MTAATAEPAGIVVPPPERHLWTELRWGISDTLVLTWRNLLRYVRLPQLLIFATVQPVLFTLLFRYVFGDSISGIDVDYADYLVPGIFVQSAMFGATNTSVGLAGDMAEGVVDRFKSLPMARPAVLTGRTLADTLRNVFVVALVTGVGYAIGFNFSEGVLAAIAAVLLALLLGFAFSWLGALIGLSVNNAEAAQAAGLLWVFPLLFVSSMFVPTAGLPDWLAAVADVSPITYTANAVRGLSIGGGEASDVIGSLAWSIGILIVFVPLAVRQYRRRT